MKQYLVMVQHQYQRGENKWSNVRWFEDEHRYFNRKADATAALKSYIAKHNRAFCYDENGKRRETHGIGGGFSADMLIDKSVDEASRVVAWKIQVREVTDWREVDGKEI